MKDIIEKGIIAHCEGNLSLHRANIEVYMKSATGIGDHSCIMQAVEKELSEISKYQGMIEAWKSMSVPKHAPAY